ncbi:MAG TPA: DUF2332 domain-containing protein [Streptosporangiaceae bacterium]|nr:DUF2332 domain-containing protein [Streptosporangiaceae bacterium]
MRAAGADEIRDEALEVAAGWSGPGAPPSWRLTAGLFQAIAAHDGLRERLGRLPPDRLPALLASAAISFLVRRDRPEPLAGYFPVPGAPQPRFDEGFFAAAREFMTASGDEIAAVCAGRRYQMNEVARCTQIALGIGAATAASTEPVTLVDLGTGAGLGLHLDRYRYQTGAGAFGPPGAAVRLDCQLRGDRRPPPAGLPPVAERVGIDVHPVDLRDPDACAWLEACAPPEATALSRLAAAVDVARRHPAAVVAGDAVDALPAVLAALRPGVLAGLRRPGRVIVVDAYLAVFLEPERRARLAAILAEAGRERPVTWLSLDPLVPLGPAGRDSVQGLPVPAAVADDYRRSGVFALLGARTFDRGTDRGRLLARAHPSGRWIDWLSPTSSHYAPSRVGPGPR